MPAVLRLPCALLALLLSALGVARLAPSAAEAEAPVVVLASADPARTASAARVVAPWRAPADAVHAPRRTAPTVVAPRPAAPGPRLGSAHGPRAP